MPIDDPPLAHPLGPSIDDDISPLERFALPLVEGRCADGEWHGGGAAVASENPGRGAGRAVEVCSDAVLLEGVNCVGAEPTAPAPSQLVAPVGEHGVWRNEHSLQG